MASPIVSMPRRSTYSEQYDARLSSHDREEFVEPLACRSRSGRGALAGVVLGAGLWAAILAVTGVIKL